MQVSTGDPLFLVYRNPSIPIILERLAIEKWGFNYIPYGKSERYTVIRINDKIHMSKLLAECSISPNKGVGKVGTNKIATSQIKDVIPVEVTIKNLISRDNFYYVMYGKMNGDCKMHIFNPPGDRIKSYKPNDDEILTPYEMEWITALDQPVTSSNCSGINKNKINSDIAYNNNDVHIQLFTMGDCNNHDITSLNYNHLINSTINQHETPYQHNSGKFILFEGVIYVEYRISDTNFVTLRTLADVQADTNIAKIITYYA